jgi:uncharacterized membrane protein YtjA (UPF0391 family)
LYRGALCRYISMRSRLAGVVHLSPAEVVKTMLSWAWMFLVIAIIAAIFGFSGIVSAAAGIAKILFFVFLVIFLISLVMGRRAVG